jgi:hypothetical protein
MAEDKLTPDQHAELERMGIESVTLKVAIWAGGHTGFHSKIGGFASGDISRGAIDGWLTEARDEVRAKRAEEYVAVLRWTKVAGWAAIISAAVAFAGIIVSIVIALIK